MTGMTPVRPPFVPAPPLASQTSSPISAQRAFFAALNGATPTPSAVSRIEAAQARRPTLPPAEAPVEALAERPRRPGALLDIRV